MYLIYRSCDYPGCTRSILGDEGTCDFCLEVRCQVHELLPYHLCYSHEWTVVQAQMDRADREMWEGFLRPLRAAVMETQAADLRPGHSCSVTIPAEPEDMLNSGLFNQCNGHLPVTFDDGIEWLVRLRQITKRGATVELQRLITASEVATMQVLHAAGLPVPQAWAVAEEQMMEFSPGVKYDYFFVQRLPGESWKKLNTSSGGGNPSLDSLKTFIEDYARFQINLTNLRFEAIGSLFKNESSVVVGCLVNHCGFNRLQPPYFLGPFKTNRARYLAHIDLVLELVGAGVHLRNDPVLSYLAHLHMREIVCSLGELGVEDTDFYLKHADDKADQCLAVGDRITGVIDWEWAYVTTKAEAFSSPKFGFGNEAHASGDNSASREEIMLAEAYDRLGRPDLAECVRNGRIYNRLNRSIGFEPLIWELNALTRAAYGEETTDMVFERESDWVAAAKEKYKENEVVQRLIREDVGGPERRAARSAAGIARLTAWREQIYGPEEHTEQARPVLSPSATETPNELAVTLRAMMAPADVPLPESVDSDL